MLSAGADKITVNSAAVRSPALIESIAGQYGSQFVVVAIDARLIDDDWYELEWKIKGDREYPTQELNWSFRIGTKVHDNPEITDVYYVSIKRSRVDYKASASSWLKNSGIEYTFDMDKDTFDAVQHSLYLEKKWPLKKRKFAFTLTVGFIWEANRKYKGSLRDEDVDNFQVALWPNLQF
jgi:hypothetical protein